MPHSESQFVSEGTTVESAAGILNGVVRSFVSAPEKVQVATEVSGNDTLFIVRVAPVDLQAVTGPSQRTLRSLRSIATALGKRSGRRFALDCVAQDNVAS